MKNKLIIVFAAILITAIIVVFMNFKTSNTVINNTTQNIIENNNVESISTVNNIQIERENHMASNIKVIIKDKEYQVTLEENETVNEFIKLLPQEYNMRELNGNEKYVNLEHTFSTNEYYPKHIEAGDIMLYGNDCLVVFYKSFDTQFGYTKIGHIEEFEDLGRENIIIRFEKN